MLRLPALSGSGLSTTAQIVQMTLVGSVFVQLQPGPLKPLTVSSDRDWQRWTAGGGPAPTSGPSTAHGGFWVLAVGRLRSAPPARATRTPGGRMPVCRVSSNGPDSNLQACQ